MSRFGQVKAAFDATRKSDPKLLAFMALAFAVGFAAFFMAGFGLIGSPILGVVLGLLAGAVAATIVFARRATALQYQALEGQPGAAVAVVQTMKGYLVTPAIAFNKKQDMVHLVIGRCGVLLLAEAQSQGIGQLVKQETQKIRRLVGDREVHTIVVGDRDGQVALDDLRVEVQKLGRSMKPDQYRELHSRLETVLHKRQPRMPAGPIPTKRPRVR